MTESVCIAHGGDVSDPSGGTDRVSAIAGGLQDRGFDVSLVVPAPDGSMPERLGDVTVTEVPVGGGFGGATRRARSVANRAREIANRDGAHLQFEHSTFAGIATLSGASGYVLDMHDLGYSRYDHVDTAVAPLLKRGVRWLERRAVSRADDVVVVSEYMQSALADWGVDPEGTTIVPNGYFPERIEHARNVNTVDGRVCFMGTLHPKVDVAAFERVASLDGAEELVVIGDGALREEVDSLAREHDAVRATGRLPDEEAFELLGSASVAINPQTTSELQRSSSPVKLYYYAALGLPMVVASGPTVVDELVGHDAAVTADGSSESADVVAGMLDDDERRSTLGENAREVANAFEWARRIDTFEAIYREMS